MHRSPGRRYEAASSVGYCIGRAFPGLADELGELLRKRIGLRVGVDLVELCTLPRSERMAQRLFDDRKLCAGRDPRAATAS